MHRVYAGDFGDLVIAPRCAAAIWRHSLSDIGRCPAPLPAVLVRALLACCSAPSATRVVFQKPERGTTEAQPGVRQAITSVASNPSVYRPAISLAYVQLSNESCAHEELLPSTWEQYATAIAEPILRPHLIPLGDCDVNKQVPLAVFSRDV